MGNIRIGVINSLTESCNFVMVRNNILQMEDLIKLLHTDNHSLEIADGEVCTFDDRMIAVVMDKIVVPEGLYKDEAICYITDRYHATVSVIWAIDTLKASSSLKACGKLIFFQSESLNEDFSTSLKSPTFNSQPGLKLYLSLAWEVFATPAISMAKKIILSVQFIVYLVLILNIVYEYGLKV